MQNAGFAALGLDWAYVPLPTPPERLGDAVRGLVAAGFAGANVTIPHKQAVIAFCDEIDEIAERAHSVNTLVIRDDRVLGSSTDGLAVTSQIDVAGRRALVLGTGGAAKAVALALEDSLLRGRRPRTPRSGLAAVGGRLRRARQRHAAEGRGRRRAAPGHAGRRPRLSPGRARDRADRGCARRRLPSRVSTGSTSSSRRVPRRSSAGRATRRRSAAMRAALRGGRG